MATVSLSRFTGCMLGGALGDALGFPIARHDTDSMFNTLLGGRGAPEGLPIVSGTTALVSDKTQMTLFTAEGLIRAHHRSVDRSVCATELVILRGYQRWLATQDARFEKSWADESTRGWLLDIPALHMMRNPSRTCLLALAETVKTPRCPTIQDPPNASDGPEALVRSAPIGLAASSAEEAFTAARDAAVITNGHASAYLSAACFAAIIWHLARGASLGDAIDDGLILLPERDVQEIMSIASIARSVGQHGVPSRESIEHIGRGDTAPQALGIALLCARGLRGSSDEAIRTCLTRAARHGGASDTTASLVGSMIGAAHGVDALPPQWLAELELHDVIEQIACDMHSTIVEGATPDASRYPPN